MRSDMSRFPGILYAFWKPVVVSRPKMLVAAVDVAVAARRSSSGLSIYPIPESSPVLFCGSSRLKI